MNLKQALSNIRYNYNRLINQFRIIKRRLYSLNSVVNQEELDRITLYYIHNDIQYIIDNIEYNKEYAAFNARCYEQGSLLILRLILVFKAIH